MDSFSIYVARASGLHDLNPITKLILTLCLMLYGLILPGMWTSYLIILFIVVPFAVWGKVLPRLSQLVFNISLPLIISVFIIQTLFWGKGTPIFEIGPFTPKWEGLLFSVTSAGRIVFIMADFILFSLTTRPDMLMISLKQAGLPGGLAYIIVTTLQLVPRFVAKANTILDAQRSRGLETQGNIRTRTRALLPLILPLVVGSLLEVEERAIAIEARAFNSKHEETSLIEIPDSQMQKLVRRGLVFATAIIILYRLFWLS